MSDDLFSDAICARLRTAGWHLDTGVTKAGIRWWWRPDRQWKHPEWQALELLDQQERQRGTPGVAPAGPQADAAGDSAAGGADAS